MRSFSVHVHLAILVLFLLIMVGVWLFPVLLMGAPHDIPPLLPVRNYAATGLFTMTDAMGRFLAPPLIRALGIPLATGNRVSIFLFAQAVPFLPFTNLLGWVFLTAVVMAASLIPWWLSVYRLFHARVAWVSTLILALMPIYWREALWLNNYQFALFFLFASFVTFIWLRGKHSLLAPLLSGLLFGLAVGAKDAFFIFVPYFVIAYAWACRRQRAKTVRDILLFGLCTGLAYLLPYVGDIARYGYPVNQNLALFFPHAKEMREEFYLHLYPDPYTYFFDRERHDRELLVQKEGLTRLERLQMEKSFINFDVGKPGVFSRLRNGAWLFFGSLSSYFFQNTLGGAFLWLFVLPGIAVLWKRERALTGSLLGLLLSTELLIRFVMHYSRDHTMDVGWIFALFAAVGISAVAEEGATKRWPASTLTACMSAIVALQLFQANRVRFAHDYARPLVADTVALAQEISRVRQDAVVALPLPPSRLEQCAQMSDRSLVLFDDATIERLLNERRLPEAFRRFGVTHIARYSPALSRRMLATMPALSLVESREIGPSVPEVTPFLRFILHQVR